MVMRADSLEIAMSSSVCDNGDATAFVQHLIEFIRSNKKT